MLKSLVVRNVQEAYVKGIREIQAHGLEQRTRAGLAMVLPDPVVTTYTHPWERVLTDPGRDANPFFHLLESFWMLAGRDDVATIARYNQGMKKYSDDGVSYHGAYGMRWRRWFTEAGFDGPSLDQLRRAIELLRANPWDRRIVISMWDPEHDLGMEGADFPCNTQIYLRARSLPHRGHTDEANGLSDLALDMTVMCRSNDAIWGAYGSNAVHFSVLQEFLAAATGMHQGNLHQMSNNLHAYTDALDKVDVVNWPVTWSRGGKQYRYTRGVPLAETMDGEMDEYRARELVHTPLFRRDSTTNLDIVFDELDALWARDPRILIVNPYGQLDQTAVTWTIEQMMAVWDAYKRGHRELALGLAHKIGAATKSDWRRACVEWLERRYTEKPA